MSADTFGFDCVCFIKALLWGRGGNIGTSAVLGDVNRIAVGSASAPAGVLSLLTSVAGLPELKE